VAGFRAGDPGRVGAALGRRPGRRATGVGYGEFAATELFAPAGMAATSSGGPGLRSLPGVDSLDRAKKFYGEGLVPPPAADSFARPPFRRRPGAAVSADVVRTRSRR
jgi:CubicO group peptidase (beta-lactamase class C family)